MADPQTKTTDSIISDAAKEGIDFREDGNQPSPSPDTTAKQDASPASSAKPDVTTETSKETTLTAGEKSVEDQFKESKLPAHLFPRFRELYAENKKIQEQLKAKEAILNDPRIARLLSQKQQAEEITTEQAKAPKAPEGTIMDEQKAALMQLKSMLGLDQFETVIKTLKERNEELSKREEQKAFDAEETDLRKLSTEYGLDFDNEVYPELTDWLSKNKQFQGLGPGSLKSAFNNVYFSKVGELAERKKNLEMMEQQKKLKSGNIEVPAKQEKGKAVKTFKNDDDMIHSLVKEAGGLENIDFGS